MALGNVHLDTTKAADPLPKRDKALQKAGEYFLGAMRIDMHNIYGANGIGCVFAMQGKLAEAREAFSQVNFVYLRC